MMILFYPLLIKNFGDRFMDKILLKGERIFLRSPCINVCFRFIIRNYFTIDDFDKAINKVCQRHPLIKSTIEWIDNNAFFNMNKGHIGVEYYTGVNNFNWYNWYAKMDNIPFDFKNGPLVMFCVIFHEDVIEIILLGHHVISDGIGYLNLIKDLLLALDKRIDPTPQIHNYKTVFKEEAKLGFLKAQYVNKMNKYWRKNRKTISEEEYIKFIHQYRNTYKPGLYLNTINETDLNMLLKTCKERKITVNEAMSAAFSIATKELTEYFPDKRLHISVAVNIRNELMPEPLECLRDYVSGIYVKMKINQKSSFGKNSKCIISNIRRRLKNKRIRHLAVNFVNVVDKDLLETVPYGSYGNFGLTLSKRIGRYLSEGIEVKSVGISNLGRHELRSYERVGLVDLQFIPPTFPASFLTVGIITINKILNICLRYNKKEISVNQVELIYKRAIELLLIQE